MQAELNTFSEAADPTLRFLAMLSGPFYPILRIANERWYNLLLFKLVCSVMMYNIAQTNYQIHCYFHWILIVGGFPKFSRIL